MAAVAEMAIAAVEWLLPNETWAPISEETWTVTTLPATKKRATSAHKRPRDQGANFAPLLLELPDELIDQIGLTLLRTDLQGLLRLCQANASLHTRLASVRRMAQAYRLQWEPELTHHLKVVEKAISKPATLTPFGVSACGLLPIDVTSRWRVQIRASFRNEGQIYIGLCTASGSIGWGLNGEDGFLYVIPLDGDRQPDVCASRGVVPVGYPCADLQPLRVMSGDEPDLLGNAVGSVIEVVWAPARGRLAFRVNAGALLPVRAEFPRGAALRPWVAMKHKDDTLAILGWRHTEPAA